jgi:hypothetical protein
MLRLWFVIPLPLIPLGTIGCGGENYGTIERPKEAGGTDAAFDKLLGAPAAKGAAKRRLEKLQQQPATSKNPKLADPAG